jgi:hypothetical protein
MLLDLYFGTLKCSPQTVNPVQLSVISTFLLYTQRAEFTVIVCPVHLEQRKATASTWPANVTRLQTARKASRKKTKLARSLTLCSKVEEVC